MDECKKLPLSNKAAGEGREVRCCCTSSRPGRPTPFYRVSLGKCKRLRLFSKQLDPDDFVRIVSQFISYTCLNMFHWRRQRKISQVNPYLFGSLELLSFVCVHHRSNDFPRVGCKGTDGV